MSFETPLLIGLLLVELAIAGVAFTVLWCLIAGEIRRRRNVSASSPAAAGGVVGPCPLSDDPLERLEAEYAAVEDVARGFLFCDACMASTPHAWRSDGTRRCVSCKHTTTTVGGTGE